MSNQVKIRRAKVEDIEQICDLSNEINAMHYREMPNDFKLPDSRLRDADHWKSYLDDPDGVVVVAEVDGQIVGALCARCILNTAVPFIVHRKKCHVGTVVVSTENVRNGIGRALMREVEIFSKESGCEVVQLDVMEFNQGAREFYRALGYSEISRKMVKDVQQSAT